jgi:hypothetical protein
MPPGAYMKIADINGVPGALALVDEVAFAVFLVEVDAVSELITTIRLIVNPEKLRLPHWPA